jgi:RNA polymerase sigma factor (sigma-70 family)
MSVKPISLDDRQQIEIALKRLLSEAPVGKRRLFVAIARKSVHDVDTAEDLVQEMAVEVNTTLKTVYPGADGERMLIAFCVNALRLQVLAFIRKRKVEAKALAAIQNRLSKKRQGHDKLINGHEWTPFGRVPTSCPDDMSEQVAMTQQVRREMELSEEQWDILCSVLMGETSVSEAATRLGISRYFIGTKCANIALRLKKVLGTG